MKKILYLFILIYEYFVCLRDIVWILKVGGVYKKDVCNSFN